MRTTYLLWILLGSLLACQSPEGKSTEMDQTDPLPGLNDAVTRSIEDPEMDALMADEDPFAVPDTSDLERTLIAQGLSNIASLDTGIRVEMKYSTTDNFLGEDVYGTYTSCYLQPEVAAKLVEAERLLVASQPDLRLIVFDCVRPRSVQYQMWEIVKGTDQQRYVAAPGGSGSMHNYGAAVDLGLFHIDSGLVDMGTPFDFFGEEAQPRYEARFLREGTLNESQIANRRILRTAMRGAGFQGIMSEWWHFVGFDRAEVRRRYEIVE